MKYRDQRLALPLCHAPAIPKAFPPVADGSGGLCSGPAVKRRSFHCGNPKDTSTCHKACSRQELGSL